MEIGSQEYRYEIAEDFGVRIVNHSSGPVGPVPHKGDFELMMHEAQGKKLERVISLPEIELETQD